MRSTGYFQSSVFLVQRPRYESQSPPLCTGRHLHTFFGQNFQTLPFVHLPSRRPRESYPSSPFQSRQLSILIGSGLDPSRCSSFSSRELLPQVNGSFILVSIFNSLRPSHRSRNLSRTSSSTSTNLLTPKSTILECKARWYSEEQYSKEQYSSTQRCRLLTDGITTPCKEVIDVTTGSLNNLPTPVLDIIHNPYSTYSSPYKQKKHTKTTHAVFPPPISHPYTRKRIPDVGILHHRSAHHHLPTFSPFHFTKKKRPPWSYGVVRQNTACAIDERLFAFFFCTHAQGRDAYMHA